MASRAAISSSRVRDTLKNGCVMPPLPVSVGTAMFWAGSLSASYSRASMRAGLRNAGCVVTSFTRSP